jgi:hypothetical protein
MKMPMLIFSPTGSSLRMNTRYASGHLGVEGRQVRVPHQAIGRVHRRSHKTHSRLRHSAATYRSISERGHRPQCDPWMCRVPTELNSMPHLWSYAEYYGLSEIITEELQHDRIYGTVRSVNPFLSDRK